MTSSLSPLDVGSNPPPEELLSEPDTDGLGLDPRRQSMLKGTDLSPKGRDSPYLNPAGLVPAVREAVKLAPESRTEEHVHTILKFVQEGEFFSQLNEFQQRGLCKTMRFEQFKKWDVIFSWRDAGDMFYVVLSGRLEVRVPSRTAPCPNEVHAEPSECTCVNREMAIAGTLEQGNGFGELALINDQPRAATVIALEETQLLEVTRSEYKRFAGQQHKEYIEQRVKFLVQVPQIEEAIRQGTVSGQDIASMANCLTESQYYGHAIVAQQGEPVDRIIFVRTGQLTMLRAVDVDVSVRPRRRGVTHAKPQPATGGKGAEEAQSPQAPDTATEGEPPAAGSSAAAAASATAAEASNKEEGAANLRSSRASVSGGSAGPDSPSSPSAPPRPRRGAGRTRRKLLRVGVIGAYQYYGEQHFIRGEDFPASLVCEALAVVYVASKHDLMRRIPRALMSALLSGSEIEDVADNKLLEMHVHTERWQSYCQDLHLEALSNRERVVGVGFRDHTASSRNPSGVVLTSKESEFFSDADSKFLRRCGEVVKDHRLQNALREEVSRKGWSSVRTDDDGPGPMNFRFENQWSRMGEGIIVNDLEQVLSAQQNPVLRVPGTRRCDRKSLRSRRMCKHQQLGSPLRTKSSFMRGWSSACTSQGGGLEDDDSCSASSMSLSAEHFHDGNGFDGDGQHFPMPPMSRQETGAGVPHREREPQLPLIPQLRQMSVAFTPRARPLPQPKESVSLAVARIKAATGRDVEPPPGRRINARRGRRAAIERLPVRKGNLLK